MGNVTKMLVMGIPWSDEAAEAKELMSSERVATSAVAGRPRRFLKKRRRAAMSQRLCLRGVSGLSQLGFVRKHVT